MRQKFIALLVVTALTLLTNCVPSPASPVSTSGRYAGPNVIIQDFAYSIYDVGVDTVYVTELKLLLENQGDLEATIRKLVVVSNRGQLEDDRYETLQPGEKETVSCSFSPPGREMSKDIGVDQIAVMVKVLGYAGKEDGANMETLAEKAATISVPRARIGDTIAEYRGKKDLPLTLLWWKESHIAVDGPYSGNEYYAFTARPGMKFVILAYQFRNNGVREQETPYLSAGEISTAPKGYCYKVWSPPLGVESKEYSPRKATTEEVEVLIGDSGGYKRLLPEESVIGCIVFEIPNDASPVEASIVYIPSLIKF